MRRWKNLGRVWMVAVFGFMYVPIAVLIAFSFNESKSRNVWAGFSLRWYKNLLGDEMILQALGVSLVVAFASAIIATVLGTLAAIGVNNMSRRRRAVVLNLSYVPIVNPEIVTGVATMLLFVVLNGGISKVLTALLGQEVRVGFGIGTLLIAHVTFCLPYVLFNVSPKLRQMDVRMYEAALDLGCNPRQAFFKVVLPEIMPAIISAFLISLTYSIDDFIISYFNSGTVQTLPIAIYSMTRKKVSPEINALSAILFAVILTIILVAVSYTHLVRDARLCGDAPGGVFMVAREKNRLHTGAPEPIHGLGCVGAQRVGQGGEPRGPSVHGEIDDGAAIVEVALRRCEQFRPRRRAVLREKRFISRENHALSLIHILHGLQIFDVLAEHFLRNGVQLRVQLVQRVIPAREIAVQTGDLVLFRVGQGLVQLPVARGTQMVCVFRGALLQPVVGEIQTLLEIVVLVRRADLLEHRLQHRDVEIDDRAQLHEQTHRHGGHAVILRHAVRHDLIRARVGRAVHVRVVHLVELEVLAQDAVVEAEVERLRRLGLGVQPQDDLRLIDVQKRLGRCLLYTSRCV